MNSLQENIKPSSVITNVVLAIRAQTQDGKKVIVVEGSTDVSFYRKFYDERDFYIFCSPCQGEGGCWYFESLCTELNPKYHDRFFIIKDADFDRLNNKRYDYSNLFITDTHDIETMKLTNAFCEKVGEMYGIDDVKSQIYGAMQDIVHLSYIKWMFNSPKSDFSFKKVNVGHCYDGSRCVEIGDWIKYIKGRNAGKKYVDKLRESVVKTFEYSHPIRDDQFLQLTNGHDFTKAMNIKIRKLMKDRADRSRKDCGVDLGDLLTSLYTLEDFQKTALYSGIAIWLQKNGG